MPQDGQLGTASDGTPVRWSAALGRAIPVSGAAVFKPPAGPAKAAPEDTKGLTDLVTAGQQKSLLASRARDFMAASGQNGGVATGPIYGDAPLISSAVPNVAKGVVSAVSPDTGNRLQALDAINNATWTALRPTGSGPIRGYEAAGWKKAFPSTANYPGANKAIADRLALEDAEARRHLQFVQGFVHSGRGGIGDAEAAYAAMPSGTDATHLPGWSQALPPAQLKAAKLFAGSKAPSGSQGNPFVPRTRDEAMKLPPGAWVLDTDGTLVQKPR